MPTRRPASCCRLSSFGASLRATSNWASGSTGTLQFSGTDSDLGPYFGEMRLQSAGKTVKGEGTFRFSGQPAVTAAINARLRRKSKKQATCEGTWHEPGDASPHTMTLDLVAA